MHELMEGIWWEATYQTFRKERGARLSRRAFVAAIKRANAKMRDYAHNFVRDTIKQQKGQEGEHHA